MSIERTFEGVSIFFHIDSSHNVWIKASEFCKLTGTQAQVTLTDVTDWNTISGMIATPIFEDNEPFISEEGAAHLLLCSKVDKRFDVQSWLIRTLKELTRRGPELIDSESKNILLWSRLVDVKTRLSEVQQHENKLLLDKLAHLEGLLNTQPAILKKQRNLIIIHKGVGESRWLRRKDVSFPYVMIHSDTVDDTIKTKYPNMRIIFEILNDDIVPMFYRSIVKNLGLNFDSTGINFKTSLSTQMFVTSLKHLLEYGNNGFENNSARVRENNRVSPKYTSLKW